MFILERVGLEWVIGLAVAGNRNYLVFQDG